jgi:predicted nucleotidyltransferase
VPVISTADRAILQQVKERLAVHYPGVRVLAYGSRARGDGQPDSDLDLCVVLETACPEAEVRARQIAWEVGFDHDVVISTAFVARDEIEEGPLRASPFVANVLREGVLA